MIFIAAKFRVRPEDADRWPEISAEFTAATRERRVSVVRLVAQPRGPDRVCADRGIPRR